MEFPTKSEVGEAAKHHEALEFTPEWFDASSDAWRSNKKRAGQSWSYVCSHELCKRIVPAGLFGDDNCMRHMALSQSEKVSKHLPRASKHSPKPTSPATLPQRRSARLVCSEGPQHAQMTKPPSSLETSPATRFSPRLRMRVSPPVPTGQGAAHTALRMRLMTQSR